MFKLSKKNKTHIYTRNVSNICKINNKDTRKTPVTSIVNFGHISLFILLLLLLNLVWEDSVSNIKFVLSNCEKYIIVLWAGKVCWATHFHLYSPKTRLRKDNFYDRPSKTQVKSCIKLFRNSMMYPLVLWIRETFKKVYSKFSVWF